MSDILKTLHLKDQLHLDFSIDRPAFVALLQSYVDAPTAAPLGLNAGPVAYTGTVTPEAFSIRKKHLLHGGPFGCTVRGTLSEATDRTTIDVTLHAGLFPLIFITSCIVILYALLLYFQLLDYGTLSLQRTLPGMALLTIESIVFIGLMYLVSRWSVASMKQNLEEDFHNMISQNARQYTV